MVPPSESVDLRLHFDGPTDAARFRTALTSLLFGASASVRATLVTGEPHDDLTAEETADRLTRGAIVELRFMLCVGEHRVEVALPRIGAVPGAVTVRAPFSAERATSCLWLQADVEVFAPIPILAMPTTRERLSIDAAHALVGLAVRSGGFEEAELAGDHALAWTRTRPKDTAPRIVSALRDAMWSVA